VRPRRPPPRRPGADQIRATIERPVPSDADMGDHLNRLAPRAQRVTTVARDVVRAVVRRRGADGKRHAGHAVGPPPWGRATRKGDYFRGDLVTPASQAS
jgi:hypothetical protein